MAKETDEQHSSKDTLVVSLESLAFLCEGPPTTAQALLPKPKSTTVCPSAHSQVCTVFQFPLKPCKFEHGNYCQYKVVNENSS